MKSFSHVLEGLTHLAFFNHQIISHVFRRLASKEEKRRFRHILDSYAFNYRKLPWSRYFISRLTSLQASCQMIQWLCKVGLCRETQQACPLKMIACHFVCSIFPHSLKPCDWLTGFNPHHCLSISLAWGFRKKIMNEGFFHWPLGLARFARYSRKTIWPAE